METQEAAAKTETTEAVTRSSSIEDQAKLLQKQLKRWAGWWNYHGDTTVAQFNYLINDHAGIAKGERNGASVDKLIRARDFARRHITDYCNRTGTKPPKGWTQ